MNNTDLSICEEGLRASKYYRGGHQERKCATADTGHSWQNRELSVLIGIQTLRRKINDYLFETTRLKARGGL